MSCPVDHRTESYSLGDPAERAGILKEKRFVHILKHSRASHLVGSMDVELLRQMLGHNIQNTMIYAHASDKQACRAALAAEMKGFRNG